MGYIIGILFMALGVFMVIKTEWIIQNFGTSAWAEEKFGLSGGTRLMYKVFGIILFFGVLGYWTGGLQNTVLRIFSGLFGF